MREACRQSAAWRDAGLGIVRVAVNVSFRQLMGDDLAAQVRQSRTGASINGKGARSFVIDVDLAPFDGQPDPEPVVTTSAGEVRHPYVVRLPAEGVLRLSFEFVPGGADLAELSARLALDPGTLSPLLKRLEQAGLVSRSRNVTDERALDVALTAAGAAPRRRSPGG